MSYNIAIASGKGGTGKTSVAVSLLQHLGRHGDRKVLLVDCDVEEPNDAIFFPAAIQDNEIHVHQIIPSIQSDACTYCRKCVEYCEFNAVSVIPRLLFSEIDPGLCHSCGACIMACSDGAIKEEKHLLGKIRTLKIAEGSLLLEGRLKIGSAMQTLMIRETKQAIHPGHDVILYDAPPGTTCPVVETITGADYVILVTEPTPFGLHDLRLMVELQEELGVPYGVVINKGGLGDNAVYDFLREKQIEILGEIPFLRAFASQYATGALQENPPPEIGDAMSRIAGRLERIIMSHEGTYHNQR